MDLDLLLQLTVLCPIYFCLILGNPLHDLIDAQAEKRSEDFHPFLRLGLQKEPILILHDKCTGLECEAIHADDIQDLLLGIVCPFL